MDSILWFKRDLRLSDHPALALAGAAGGRVLPLYVVEPEYWAQPDTSARQWDFTAECLDDLRAACKLGLSLAALTLQTDATVSRELSPALLA